MSALLIERRSNENAAGISAIAGYNKVKVYKDALDTEYPGVARRGVMLEFWSCRGALRIPWFSPYGDGRPSHVSTESRVFSKPLIPTFRKMLAHGELLRGHTGRSCRRYSVRDHLYPRPRPTPSRSFDGVCSLTRPDRWLGWGEKTYNEYMRSEGGEDTSSASV